MALIGLKQLDPILTGSLQVSGSAGVTGSIKATTGSFGYLNVDGDAVIAGNFTFGDAATDSVSFTADISSSLIPDSSDSYNLGSSGQRWNDLYLSGSINATGGPITLTSDTTLSAKGNTGASFGDDVGTWEFNGSGAVSETGMTTVSVTPSSTVDIDAGGAITIDGASLTVGGDGDTSIIKLTGPVTATTHVSASGNLSATGNLDIDGTANIAGDTTLQSDLSVVDINASGNITGSNNISASGNLYLSGTADIDGNVDIDNTTTTIDSSGAISLDAGAASNFNASAGVIKIDSEAANVYIDGHTGVHISASNSGTVILDGKAGVSLKEDGTDVIAIYTNRDVL